MTNILLCGGSGTRLWPISRTLMPKQFVKLFDDKSMFQLTLERNKSVCSKHLIISNAQQYFLASDQLEELKYFKNKFLLEPFGRNTAPAIALSCFLLDKDEIVLVSPSDHLIEDKTSYLDVLKKAKHLAESNYLVTFGIVPTYAESGYGYIEFDDQNVKAFHEKPDEITAQKYINTKKFYWNSGMFCFKAGVFLDELKKYSPEIYQKSKKAIDKNKFLSTNVLKIDYDSMLAIPEDSIDYAVMEKSLKVKMVIADIGWSDLGSFDALDKIKAKDANGNTECKNLYTVDSKNNFVHSKERTIALNGVDDLIVVDTKDALLISKKCNSQNIKKIIKQLKEDKSELHHMHLNVHRPWGTYTTLEKSSNFKTKIITIKPKKRISLQKHFHRSEHWVVVSGIALVTIGSTQKLLRPNESSYIPVGKEHRLENPGKIDVVIIEVQVGEYIDEDDILRLEDDYNRD